MQPADLIEVGRVLATHGVRGALKIAADAGPDSVLADVKAVWLLARDGAPVLFDVTGTRAHGAHYLFTLKGLDSPEAAAIWRGARVQVPRASFPKAEPDEVYWVDLLGCQVVTTGSAALGAVTAVDDHGGGPFLRVLAADGVERLIPYVPVYIVEIDVAARRLVADWDPAWD